MERPIISSSETSLKSYFSSSLLWKSFLYPCDMTSESMAYAKSFLVHFLKQRYVYYNRFFLTLESRIDVGQGISIGSGKLG